MGTFNIFKSIEQVYIGGLLFLPSTMDLVLEMLDALIIDSPESAFERATLPSGIEERLAKVDWKKREVLIVLVESKEQLHSFLEEKYFRVKRSCVAQENLPIYYVVLYEKNVGSRW